MRVKVDFNELSNALSYANTVLSDKSVDEKSKNFIFNISNEELYIIGYSAFIFTRIAIENWEILEPIPDDGWKFQVKASEMNKIITSFSSLSLTKVEGFYLYDDGVRIGVEVEEVAIEEDKYPNLSQTVSFFLENSSITGKVLMEINTEFPEDDAELLNSGDLFLYLDTLSPIMSNDVSSSLASKMNFADEYVFVVSSSMAAFMPNKLPEALKGFALTYSSISFLKKVCSTTEEDIGTSIAKTSNYLCLHMGNIEAFMKYQKIKVKYQIYMDRRKTDNGVKVSRFYLKDVLKRMGSLSPDGKVEILEDGSIRVENSNFNQIIPTNSVKGEVSGINFNVSIPILEKVILGADEIYTEDLFIYFVPITRGYIIFISDKSGSWYANMQVTNA